MLGEKERLLLSKLAQELTGCDQTGDTRQNSLASNVERRLRELGLENLYDYLKLVDEDPNEHANLISALTIHTTSWFRENPHFVVFQELLLKAIEKNEVFTVWCAACSTGEEAYSFAIVLEEFRRVHPKFEYRVLGTDIDPVSIATAQKAVYSDKGANFLLSRYNRHLLFGSGRTDGFFTLSKDVRSRCSFRVNDLRTTTPQAEGPFNVAICRNVLIYFKSDTVNRIVGNVVGNLKSEGHLLLGHSESINAVELGVVQRGHSVYCKTKAQEPVELKKRGSYKILSIDDSAAIRQTLKKQFIDFGFEAHSVASADDATEFLRTNKVDLITLDLQMPGEGGEARLEKQRRAGLKTPVVVVSDVHSADATAVIQILARGAQDYMEKETILNNLPKLKETFIEIIRGHETKPSSASNSQTSCMTKYPDLIMIGASTGGPQALVQLLARMPENMPPIVVTQHISSKFTRPLAERIASVSGLQVGNCEPGTKLLPGHIYMAHDDHHIGIGEVDGAPTFISSQSPPVNGHRPSVDFMFNSVVGSSLSRMAILLTGMGKDGAAGLLALKRSGAFCVAQSEEDCVVYGMPRAAIALDATHFIGNLDEIRQLVIESVSITNKKAS